MYFEALILNTHTFMMKNLLLLTWILYHYEMSLFTLVTLFVLKSASSDIIVNPASLGLLFAW